jgi:hypothetical protein
MDGFIRGSRAVALCGAAVLAVACGSSGPPQIEFKEGEGAVTADGLHRVQTRRVGAAFVRPGANLSSYSRIKLADITISYEREPRVRADRAGAGRSAARGNFALPDSTKEWFKNEFQSVFAEELGRSEVFEVVDEAGPDVLLVAGHIVDLVVTAPRDPTASRGSVWVTESGRMTLLLDVRDSQSNTALARMADRRAVRPGGGTMPTRSSVVSNTGEVRQMLRRWARQLREALDGLHQLPEIPAAPPPEGESAG